jgi:hypothetical protein
MRNYFLPILLVAAAGTALAETRSPGKPGAPVSIEHRLLGAVEPGQPVDIEITLRATGRVESLSYTVEAAPGLGLMRAEPPRRLAKVREGDSDRQVLRLRPTSAGVHAITVSVVSEQGGRQRATTRLIEVPVGAGAKRGLAAPGQLVEGRDRTVVVLPAEGSRR